MIPTLRLFFDECCSRRLPAKISEVFEEDLKIETKHLVDIFSAGDDDENWLPLLEDGGEPWIVITADRGRDPRKPKLPLICEQLSITHILMTPTLKDLGYRMHKQALFTVWPQIVRCGLLPQGTKVSLGLKRFSGGGTVWPHLQIEGRPFDAWCTRNGLGLADD